MKHWPISTIAIAATLYGGSALAHPGHHSDGFAAGALHPLTGLGHLLAIIAVGLWAGLVFRKGWQVWPTAIITLILGGFAFAAAQGLDFALGFALVTICLHAVGVALSALALGHRGQALAHAAGVGIAAVGAMMLLG